jgi:hypothetical protein
MKRFHELKMAQQQDAVEYALNELRSAISEGFIDFGKTLSEETLREYAIAAAETAYYSEREDKIIADIA